MIGNFVSVFGSTLWGIFLPLIMTLGIYVIIKMLRNINKFPTADDSKKLTIKNAKSALSISVSSKIGTGAVIGVLAALWKTSNNGIGGEAIVLWVLIGMIVLVPITYAEVFFTQITNKLPRAFVESNIGAKSSIIYIFALVVLYSFGFVGFQFTGIQTVGIILSEKVLGYQLGTEQMLFFVVIPMIVLTAIIIITKNHLLFIDVLGSLISIVIVLYIIMFGIFLVKTADFIPIYFSDMFKDFFNAKTMGIGLPVGLVVGFQRIIQTSETVLGTSALASSDKENNPKQEAYLQVIATLITLFVAVVITSYIFAYGRSYISGVELTENGFSRILGYIKTVEAVTGNYGLFVILVFFLFSGYCTVLGSFHFLNTSMHFSANRKIIFYLILISISGFLSISNFGFIFDVVDLLMFVVGFIIMVSLFKFSLKGYKVSD